MIADQINARNTQLNTRSFAVATYAVLTCRDSLGSYYLLSPSWAINEALDDGWEVVASDMRWLAAYELRAHLYDNDTSVFAVQS